MKEEIEEPNEMDEGAEGSASHVGDPGELDGADPGELIASNTDLTRERDELKDILIRKQAEFENFRKRTERERSEFVQFAASGVVEGMLDVLDSFELAIRDRSDDESAASLHQGFELIFKQLVDSLERQGLAPIAAQGQGFDPHFHQAVSTQPSSEFAEGTVIEELRKGYTLNGRLLRAAMVVVSAGPESESAEEDTP